MANSGEPALQDILKLQSLLMQFIHPQVRRDLLAGQLGVSITEEMLLDIDCIRRYLSPPWRGVQTTMQLSLQSSITHVKALFGKSEEVFALKADAVWTYKQWSELFHQLGTSQYWVMVDHRNICIEHLTVLSDSSRNPGETVSRKAVDCRDPEDVFAVKRDPSCSPGSRFVTRRQRNRVSAGGKFMHQARSFEEICISDTTSDSDTEGSDYCTAPEPHYRRKNTKVQKEIVKPLPFEPNGWQSLKHFLASYEKYFYAKFDGSSRDCTQELVNFLPSDMGEYYNAVGGRRLKFSDMKVELFSWYKSNQRYNAQHWREKLRSSQRKSGESLKLYGMRLRDIGQKAFPHSERECLREIRHQFLQTIPVEFATHIMRNEDCTRDKLTWSEIMRLAEGEDRRLRRYQRKQEEPLICFSQQDVAGDPAFRLGSAPGDLSAFQPSSQQLEHGQNEVGDPVVCFNQRETARREPAFSSGPAHRESHEFRHPSQHVGIGQKKTSPPRQFYGKGSAARSCQWCGRENHTMDSCWEKQGACFLCGSLQHRRANCPKAGGNFKFGSKIHCCPLCAGDHLGRDCLMVEKPLNTNALVREAEH
jgi:hypothetical protein